jgi:rhodanese-related sulfurtransferase
MLSVALVCAAALAGCSLSDPKPSSGGSEVTTVSVGGSQLLTPAEFAATIAEDGVTVVNVHVPYEGHIAGTDAFVPFDSIGSWSDLPDDRTTPIAVYCRSGTMSAAAADSLLELGYTNVVDLAGGMNAWIAAGQQLEKS